MGCASYRSRPQLLCIVLRGLSGHDYMLLDFPTGLNSTCWGQWDGFSCVIPALLLNGPHNFSSSISLMDLENREPIQTYMDQTIMKYRRLQWTSLTLANNIAGSPSPSCRSTRCGRPRPRPWWRAGCSSPRPPGRHLLHNTQPSCRGPGMSAKVSIWICTSVLFDSQIVAYFRKMRPFRF